MLSDLRVTNDSLLTTKTNEIMKALTAAAFVMIPATLIAQMFSIPATGIPFVHEDGGFSVILGFMLSAVIAALVFFKSKKWL